jgi:hypothetical protein
MNKKAIGKVLSDAIFNEEIITRRQQAFLGRRSDESSLS